MIVPRQYCWAHRQVLSAPHTRHAVARIIDSKKSNQDPRVSGFSICSSRMIDQPTLLILPLRQTPVSGGLETKAQVLRTPPVSEFSSTRQLPPAQVASRRDARAESVQPTYLQVANMIRDQRAPQRPPPSSVLTGCASVPIELSREALGFPAVNRCPSSSAGLRCADCGSPRNKSRGGSAYTTR